MRYLIDYFVNWNRNRKSYQSKRRGVFARNSTSEILFQLEILETAAALEDLKSIAQNTKRKLKA